VTDGSPQIDTSVPHSARVWNYWLGGKDNYPVDRAAGDQFREIFPEIVDAARASRGFLTRVVRFLAGEAGIRQFLDVGTGLRRWTTPTRSPSGWPPTAGSCTWTTTRWC
jgi:hypothetical protein